MSDDPLSLRYDHAIAWAKAAGRITLQYFRRSDLEVERKGDDSPVTAGDRASESFLREQIQKHYPDDAIVGEEFGVTDGTSGYRWILDPIDGTKSFIHGVPLYGTLVGVEHNDSPEIGVIEIPALDERVYARLGHGAWSQVGEAEPQPARVRETTDLAEALLVTTEFTSFRQRGAEKVFLDLDKIVRLTRTWGDCYGYLLVATGRADIMIDPYLSVWDAAAVAPVLLEAGGIFTDWQGEETIHGGDGLGANQELSDKVVLLTALMPPP